MPLPDALDALVRSNLQLMLDGNPACTPAALLLGNHSDTWVLGPADGNLLSIHFADRPSSVKAIDLQMLLFGVTAVLDENGKRTSIIIYHRNEDLPGCPYRIIPREAYTGRDREVYEGLTSRIGADGHGTWILPARDPSA